MKCAVCGKEINEKKPICPSCGFDYSCCVELHPTFVKEIGVQKTLSQRKKEDRNSTLKGSLAKKTPAKVMKYGCLVCGYLHEGDAAPEYCPICKAPRAKFIAVFEAGTDANLAVKQKSGVGIKQDNASDSEKTTEQEQTIPKEFVVNKDGVLMNYTGSAETVVIPDGIKSIRRAFSSNKTVRKVILPESVKRIGVDAFSWSSLQSIELPKGLTFIGNSAFKYSQLTSISLPEKLKTIGEYAFSNTRLQEISVPGKTSKISYQAFSECKELEVVRIETGVKELGGEAFSHCPKLKTIYIPDTVEKIDGKTFKFTEIQTAYASDAWKRANPELLRKMVPDPIEEKNYEIEGTKLVHYFGRATEPQIPAQVTTIGSEAFSYNSHITKIVIPEHVTAIESSAFYWCENLREVILPDHIIEIGSFTFAGCRNLHSFHFPRNLRAIGKSAFSFTGLPSVVLPPALTTLESECFERCEKLSAVHIPDSLEEIKKNECTGKYDAFEPRYVKVFYVSRAWAQKHQDFLKTYPKAEIRYEEAITIPSSKDFEISGTTLARYLGEASEVTVPNGITEIGAKAFESNKKIRKVILPKTVRCIEEEAFKFSGLEEIVLPEGLESIAQYAFWNSALMSIQLPESLRSIGVRSFADTKLQSITLPGSLQMIPEGAFYHCKELKTVIIKDGVRTLGKDAFRSCPSLETVEIPDSLAEMCTHPRDSSFSGSKNIKTVLASKAWKGANPALLLEMVPDSIEAKNFVTRNHVLVRYYGRASVPIIPGDVTAIGEYAFFDNDHIQMIVIPDRVTSIAQGAFFLCSNLSSVTLSAALRTIEPYCFDGTGITRLKLPSQLTTVRQSAFCTSTLTEISFPDTLTKIENNAFDGYYLSRVKKIYASRRWAEKNKDFLSDFSNAVIVDPSDNRSSTNLTIDQSFRIENNKLIQYLGKENHIKIPEGVTEIGAHVFADNRDLRHIVLPKSVTKIGEYAFSNCSNLSGLLLPDGVQTIGKGAFSGSGIDVLKVPDGVQVIQERLCENCSKLFAVVLPKHDTKIESFAFSGCDQIVSAPTFLMNFRNVQILEGNECLMRGVVKSAQSTMVVIAVIIRNLEKSDLNRYTPQSFLYPTDDAFADKFYNASKAYVGDLTPDELPVLMLDSSMFGNGKSGFVITTRRIYCKQLWDKRSYPLSQLIGFARQEDRFGFAVKNGERPFLPFFSKAKSADAAQKIIEALDAACNWLKILNEPT